MSSPVFGSVVACFGLLIFFGMLNLIRRPGAGRWLKSRLVRELTVFTSMIILIGGLGVCAQYLTMRNRQPLEFPETLGILAALTITVLIVWRLYRPIPPEELPEPVLGYDPLQLHPANPPPASPPPGGSGREKVV